MKFAKIGTGARSTRSMLAQGRPLALALFLAVDVHAQNVGIGFSNPASKLTVNGNFAVGANYNTAAPTNGALIEGFTGIAIQTPQVPLHVNGRVYVAGAGITGDFYNGTANKDGVEIDPQGGWVGAQSSEDAPLNAGKPTNFTSNVLVNFSLGVNATDTSTIIGQIVTNGSGVLYQSASDERLKENIRPTAKGLNDVMRIQVSDYNFKSKPGTNETGYIAQQLYTVLPDAVNPGGENAAKKPWTVDYGRVTPLLTRAIQQQQEQIEDLKEQVQRLQSKSSGLAKANSEPTTDSKRLAAAEARIREQDRKIGSLEAENARLGSMAAEIESLKKAVASMQQKRSTIERTVALSQ